MTYAGMIRLGREISIDGSDTSDRSPVTVYVTAPEARKAAADLLRLAGELEAAEAKAAQG